MAARWNSSTAPGRPSQPQAFEAVLGLEMGKPHLHGLAFVARPGVRLGQHLGAREVAGIFVRVARNYPVRCVRAADLLPHAGAPTVETGAMAPRRILERPAGSSGALRFLFLACLNLVWTRSWFPSAADTSRPVVSLARAHICRVLQCSAFHIDARQGVRRPLRIDFSLVKVPLSASWNVAASENSHAVSLE